MLIGYIAKEGHGWIAICDVAGAYTQGRSRSDAAAMLADCLRCLIDDPALVIDVVETRPTDDDRITVHITANKPALLAARVLLYQRDRNRLTLEEVTERVSDYTVYERGERDPSLSKFRELLAAVAPDLALAVIETKTTRLLPLTDVPAGTRR